MSRDQGSAPRNEVVFSPTSWHVRRVEYWRANAMFPDQGNRLSVFQHFRVALIWAPLTWLWRTKILPIAIYVVLAAAEAFLIFGGLAAKSDDALTVAIMIPVFGATPSYVWITNRICDREDLWMRIWRQMKPVIMPVFQARVGRFRIWMVGFFLGSLAFSANEAIHNGIYLALLIMLLILILAAGVVLTVIWVVGRLLFKILPLDTLIKAVGPASLVGQRLIAMKYRICPLVRYEEET